MALVIRDEIKDSIRDRVALVTGATGFIGSHLVDALVECGCRVHAIARTTSSGLANWTSESRQAAAVHWADLVDPFAVRAAVRAVKEDATKPVYVFHLAAQAHVGESWTRLRETFDVN